MKEYIPPQTADEIVEIVKAYQAGASIQFRSLFYLSDWIDTKEPKWNFAHFEYRVKNEEMYHM